MASYLRSIFWGRDSSKSNPRHADTSTTSSGRNGKSHSRSRSESPTTTSPTKSKHLRYLYAEPGGVPPASIQTTTRERSNSLTAARANAPSPLRYTYKDTATTRGHSGHPHIPAHHTSHSLDGANSKIPLYRTSSHKAGERRKSRSLSPRISFHSAHLQLRWHSTRPSTLPIPSEVSGHPTSLFIRLATAHSATPHHGIRVPVVSQPNQQLMSRGRC